MPPFPYKLPPIVIYLIGGVTTIAGLLVTQGFIENRWEKTIGGIAAVVIPPVWMLGTFIWNAVTHHAAATVQAAQFAAAARTRDAVMPIPAPTDPPPVSPTVLAGAPSSARRA